ncbi:hypothetical protein TNCV_926681 [Trichonephila clavipes]|nr:hypothetical protein TNCV_926681 [Trichonephila clavipes]
MYGYVSSKPFLAIRQMVAEFQSKCQAILRFDHLTFLCSILHVLSQMVTSAHTAREPICEAFIQSMWVDEFSFEGNYVLALDYPLFYETS